MSETDKILKQIIDSIDSLQIYIPSVDLDELTELVKHQSAVLEEIRDALKAR